MEQQNMIDNMAQKEGKETQYHILISRLISREISDISFFFQSGSLKRRTPRRGKRDSIYSLLVGNGTLGGFFIQTKHKRVANDILPHCDSKVLVLANKKRPGETAMLAYLEWAVEKEYLVAGDLLLMDNESSFKTELVQEFLVHHHIEYDYFPPYQGSIMNPCDNSFHKDLKDKYYEFLHNKTTMTLSEKFNFARKAYFSVKEISIKNMFAHVGLTSGKPETVVAKLLSEGHHPLKKNQARYKHQIRTFLKWANDTDFEFDSNSERKLFNSIYPSYLR
jgi:TfoX/Sxy family transcriptional regulator of competence genes